MQVTCNFCGEVFEANNDFSSCPKCRSRRPTPSMGTLDRLPLTAGLSDKADFPEESSPFDCFGADDEIECEPTKTYDLASLQNIQSLMQNTDSADELFDSAGDFSSSSNDSPANGMAESEDDSEEESRGEPGSGGVKADDIFALFGAPAGGGADPALDVAASSRGEDEATFGTASPAPELFSTNEAVTLRPVSNEAPPDFSGVGLVAAGALDASTVLPRLDTQGLFGNAPQNAAFPVGSDGSGMGNTDFSSPLTDDFSAGFVPNETASRPPSSSAMDIGAPTAGFGENLQESAAVSPLAFDAVAQTRAEPTMDAPASATPEIDFGAFSLSGSDLSSSAPAPAPRASVAPSAPMGNFSLSDEASGLPSVDLDRSNSPSLTPSAPAPTSPTAPGGSTFGLNASSEPGLELDFGELGQKSSKSASTGNASDRLSFRPLSSSAAFKSDASNFTPISGVKRSNIGVASIIGFGAFVVVVLILIIGLWNFSGDILGGHVGIESAPPPIAAVIEKTVRQQPQVIERAKGGSADEFIQQGISLMRADTAVGYREAQMSFIQALAVSPLRADAMALYVEATLHVRPEGDYVLSCRSIMDLALEKAPQTSLTHRANAFLLMREEKEDEASSEAEKSVSLALPEEKADALLMLGYSYLGKNVALALEKIVQAVQLDPKLKRAIYFQGLAAENAGDLLKAAKAYDARLALDAKERDSMQGLVRVYLKLGHLEDVRRTLDTYLKSYPQDLSPQLWKVALILRQENGLTLAAQSLRKLEKSLDQMTTSERGMFYRLNAERQFASREYALAKKSVDAAIGVDPRDGAAHFLGLKIAIAQKKTTEAKKHLKAVQRHLSKELFHEFAGRLAVMEGNLDEAMKNFQAANSEKTFRLCSLVMEGVLHLKNGNERAAWSLHSRILELDPYSRSKEVPALGDFLEAERPLFELARSLLGRPSGKGNTQWLYAIYGALLAYHVGETSSPAQAFDQVISGDPTSLISLVYRAQIELDRRNLKRAKKFIDTAIHVDQKAPLPWFLRGKLLKEHKDLRGAQDSWMEAMKRSSHTDDIDVQLAFLSVSNGDSADAIRRFRRVLATNPNLESVRSALFDLERNSEVPID